MWIFFKQQCCLPAINSLSCHHQHSATTIFNIWRCVITEYGSLYYLGCRTDMSEGLKLCWWTFFVSLFLPSFLLPYFLPLSIHPSFSPFLPFAENQGRKWDGMLQQQPEDITQKSECRIWFVTYVNFVGFQQRDFLTSDVSSYVAQSMWSKQ